MKFELAGKCYPSKQMIIFCAVQCTIGISEIYLGCKCKRGIFYPQGLLQAAQLHASCVFLPSSLQVLLSDRHVDQDIKRNTQGFKGLGVLSHLSLEMRKKEMQKSFEA